MLIHFLISILVISVLSFFILNYWFPYGLFKLLKGWELFLLFVGCDLILGPVLSFVVINNRKSSREIFLDLFIVVLIQIIALSYGVYSISQNRLLFLVFSLDRYEVVSAGELSKEELSKAKKLEWRNPKIIENYVVQVDLPPIDSLNYLNLTLSGLNGRDVQYFPEYYIHIKNNEKNIRPINDLPNEAKEKIEGFLSKIDNFGEIGWVPLIHNKIYWIMLVNKNDTLPIRAFPIDPYQIIK